MVSPGFWLLLKKAVISQKTVRERLQWASIGIQAAIMANPDPDQIIEALRREIEALHAKLAQRDERVDALAKEITKARSALDLLNEKYQLLLRRLYGRKSEKSPEPGPLELLPDDEPPEDPPPHVDEAPDDEGDEEPDDEGSEEPAEPAANPAPAKKRRKRRATKLKDLPRIRIEHDVDPAARICACCGDEKKKFGEEVTEEIEYVPASVVINEHVRPKYACRRCGDGVVIADLPPRLVDGGLPGPGLIAQIVTSKYSDHLPLNRQEAIFLRHGLELSRKTMCDWIRVASELLHPIMLEMRRELLLRPVIHADETPVMMRVGPNERGCRTAYLWVWMSAEEDLVLYEFHPTRGQSVVEAMLDDFEGEILVVDAYAGYNPCTNRGFKRSGCLAHARRYAREGMGSNPQEASELVALIQLLYVVERRAKELCLDADATLELRQRESVPLLNDLRETVDRLLPSALPKSALGKALGYIDGQWSRLTLFAEDGRVPIDNNACERMIRPVAVGRKNWLFAGSLEGGRRAATLYTLVQTCRRIGIDPFAYLRDVLSRVSTHPHRRIAELTPGGWKAASEAVKATPVDSDSTN